MTDSNIM